MSHWGEILDHDLAGYRIVKGYYLSKFYFFKGAYRLVLKVNGKLVLTRDVKMINEIKDILEDSQVKIISAWLLLGRKNNFFFDSIFNNSEKELEPVAVYDYNTLQKHIPKGWGIVSEVFEWQKTCR
jgi:hypothetical protein